MLRTGRDVQVWGRKGVSINDVMDQGLRVYAHVVAIPWDCPTPLDSANPDHVEAALATAVALMPSTEVCAQGAAFRACHSPL